MFNKKTLVCRCEDVTLSDIQKAYTEGYQSIEDIKRYTGLGTGPCQGKECLAMLTRELKHTYNNESHLLIPFTARPPVSPTPIAHLAAAYLDNKKT